MRKRLGVFLLVMLVQALPAQQPQQPQFVARDGGASEMLRSIFVPPLLNSPFTAVVHTQWIKSLADGGTITLVNQRRIARDSRGHIYQERATLPAKSGNVPSAIMRIQISDPDSHLWYDCPLFSQPHSCTLDDYGLSPVSSYKPEVDPNGPLPNKTGSNSHEDLGTRTVEGIQTVGTRVTTHYNAGVFGNDQPITVEREFWQADTLGLNLISQLTDPRVGKQIFTVTDIKVGDPDPKLFEPPEGFEVVDRRRPQDPSK
jgi:hypothetical protein